MDLDVYFWASKPNWLTYSAPQEVAVRSYGFCCSCKIRFWEAANLGEQGVARLRTDATQLFRAHFRVCHFMNGLPAMQERPCRASEVLQGCHRGHHATREGAVIFKARSNLLAMTGRLSLACAVGCAGQTNHGNLLQSRAGELNISGRSVHYMYQRLCILLTTAVCCAGLMKFGKLLQSRAEELKSTGLTEHFLRYKALKKTLKQISKEEDQQTEAQNGDAAAG